MILSSELTKCLPAALEERVRLLGRDRLNPSGEYVLYWMRCAIRVDENQSLNAAIHFANRLRLPVLVYQGLSQRYPFASDRHHTFILEAARDIQHSLASTNLAYALHVERAGNLGPHLKILAERAAVVVTEDMPVQPLCRWTNRLSRAIGCSLFAVDTACVVPMRIVGKSFDRAFLFRNATKTLYAERVSTRPEICQATIDAPQSLDLPFEPVQLKSIEIAHLVSQCGIDHSIGPVPHTPGGSVAGYQRWKAFKENGLSSYDQRRNDPLIDGGSRMSPYLHYGMVAPMRLAREAAADPSDGAAQFLDELLFWRELAYVFCFYRPEHGRIAAIPEWARDTLREHESDSRELLSWETMSRGRTGDSIWDSAQRSLLIHGELHNSVRMTWGKAILNWTRDAKNALSRLIDLNHRYALDGCDPASYGGLLWCLGQFDRPFLPPQSILGTVRTRSTEQQAEWVDPIAYGRKVTRPLWDPVPKIAVIGAGISGLMGARILADHGCDVDVFEKSRGVSGRMSTRRVDDTLSFDHGAQYFTARDPCFQRYVKSWIDDNLVKPWHGRIVVVEDGTVKAEKSGDTRYVAVPGMSSLGKHLAADLNVQLQTQVAAPRRAGEKWLLTTTAGSELGLYDVVVAAAPSQQSALLLAEAPELAVEADAVKMNGCWALMLAFAETLSLGYDGAFVHGSSLSWIARNSNKAGRKRELETWVVHASGDWSQAHRDDLPEVVQALLIDAFKTAVGRASIQPTHAAVHRWRLAIPSEPLSCRSLFDDERKIGACGDWCGGPRVEGAFLSGISIAGRILGQLSPFDPQT